MVIFPCLLKVFESFMLKISWDGLSTVELQVPIRTEGEVCGICGTLDGKLYIGPHDKTHKDDTIGCGPKASSKSVGEVVSALSLSLGAYIKIHQKCPNTLHR